MRCCPFLHPADEAFSHPGFTIVALEAPVADRVELGQCHLDERAALATRERAAVVPEHRSVGDREVSEGRPSEEGAHGEKDGAQDRVQDEVDRRKRAEQGRDRREDRI